MDLPSTRAAPHPEATAAAGSRITIATTGLTAQIAAEAGGGWHDCPGAAGPDRPSTLSCR
jgi:hypothetical protein